MYIGFTGHRDKGLPDVILNQIVRVFGDDNIWLHGGAVGFDKQIEKLANDNKIRQIIFLPEYNKYNKSAPLMRNKEIVNACALLIACYDLRTNGGTYFTLEYAKNLGKDIVMINPDTLTKQMIKPQKEYWYCDSEWACGMLTTIDGRIIDSAPVFKKLIGLKVHSLPYKIIKLEKS